MYGLSTWRHMTGGTLPDSYPASTESHVHSCAHARAHARAQVYHTLTVAALRDLRCGRIDSVASESAQGAGALLTLLHMLLSL